MKNSLKAALLPLCMGGIISTQAADLYWGTATPNAIWQNAGNWFQDAAGTTPAVGFPGASDNVFFNITSLNATAVSPVFSATTFANSITFNNSVAMVITGTSGNRNLEIGSGGITLAASATSTTLGSTTGGKNVFVKIAADQTWTNNSAGTFNVRNSSQASDLAAGPVVLTLNAASTGNISNSGAFSDGAGGSLGIIVDSTGSGIVSMGGGSYSGGTTVRSGVLQSGGNFGSGGVVLGHTSGAANTRLLLTSSATNTITVRAGNSGTAALTGNTGTDYQGGIVLERDVVLGSLSSSGQTVQFSGVISGTGNVIAARLGSSTPTVVLSGSNTYVGRTTIDSAVVVASSLNRVVGGSASSSLGAAPLDATAGTIRMSAVGGSTLRYTGTGEATDRVIEIASNLGATLDQSGSGHLNFTSALANAGTGSRTLTLTGTTAGTGEFSGAIDNIGTGTNVGVTKNGSGTWRLSGTANTYASTTSITGGVLEVTKLADTGVASSIGTASIGQLSFSSGTLRYIGSGDSTNRTFTIGAAGGTLDASGSGAVNFTRTAAPSYGSSNVPISLTLTGTNGDANTYALNQNNNGSGAVSITKNGTGKWVLTGTTTYTGGTTVNEGTLLINGSSVSAVTVNGGVFGGTGTITGSVSIGNDGTLAPGNSPGTINTGALSLTGTASTIAMEISGTSLGLYDQVNVTGTVNLDGNGQIEVTMLSFVPQPAEIYFLILNDGVDAISGTLYGIAQDGTFNSGGYTWQVSYTGDSAGGTFTGGNDLALQVVPEPTTMILLTGGLMAVTLLRRRRV